MARPTDYSEDILKEALSYLESPLPEDEVVHSIEGLSVHLGVARSTIYLWSSQADKKEFSDITERILAKQGKTLVNKGLSGDFNSAISKVMLSKHGYAEKTETDITSKGASIVSENKEAEEASALAYAEVIKKQKT